MNKICSTCKIGQPETEFYKDAKSPGGRRGQCKTCKNKQTVEWREKNRERYNETARKHNRMHYPDYRLRRYNLTVEKHTLMLVGQNDACSLCGNGRTEKRPLAIDHHHTDKYVRELLCYGCNRFMSIVDDNDKLLKFIAYRDKHAAKNKKAA